MGSKKEESGLPLQSIPGVNEDAVRAYYDRGGGLNVDKHRAFLIIALILVLYIVGAVSFNILLPLKTVAPYRVTDGPAQKATADFTPFNTYTPQDVDVIKSLKYWAKGMYTILGPKQVVVGVEEARQMLTGQALAQFGEWFANERPTITSIEKPTLTRTVEATVSLLPDNVALIHVITTTRESDGANPVIKKILFTVKHTYIKPQTVEDANKNANGVYIQHFTYEEQP